MSGPWQTPPAGSELPPRNGNVQRYETRLIQSRNTVTGDQWQVGREVIFNFESDPASGWLCPSESKLYMRARLKQIADNGTITDVVPSQAMRFAASPLFGLFDSCRYSQNGTTVQQQSGDLDTLAHFQLRLTGSRESHDTNGSLGMDSLRQKMMHPEQAYTTTLNAAKGVTETFNSQVIPNEKHKTLLDRFGTGNNADFELASPVSLALTSWGISKFIAGASHDLRFTIGAHGKNMRKSLYTEEVPPTPVGQATVVSGVATHSSNLSLDSVAVPTAATSAASVTKLKTTRATDADNFSYDSANAANKEQARSSMLARCAAAIPVYDDTLANHGLILVPEEIYLAACYVLPVYNTVPRPLSWQATFDHIHLISRNIPSKTSIVEQIQIPVNTTRIVVTFSENLNTLAFNRELIGQSGGQGDPAHLSDKRGSVTGLSINLSGVSLPAPAYALDFTTKRYIRAWQDWQSFLKGSISNAVGSQNSSEWADDPAFAFRIMGDRSSVAQNLTVRADFKNVGNTGTSANCVMNVFCVGTMVWENVYDDEASFQPTSVSVQEVI